jgi:hypothetical protein
MPQENHKITNISDNISPAKIPFGNEVSYVDDSCFELTQVGSDDQLCDDGDSKTTSNICHSSG